MEIQVELSKNPTVGELVNLIVTYSIVIITALAAAIVYLYWRNQKQGSKFADVTSEVKIALVELKSAINNGANETSLLRQAILGNPVHRSRGKKYKGG